MQLRASFSSVISPSGCIGLWLSMPSQFYFCFWISTSMRMWNPWRKRYSEYQYSFVLLNEMQVTLDGLNFDHSKWVSPNITKQIYSLDLSKPLMPRSQNQSKTAVPLFDIYWFFYSRYPEVAGICKHYLILTPS